MCTFAYHEPRTAALCSVHLIASFFATTMYHRKFHCEVCHALHARLKPVLVLESVVSMNISEIPISKSAILQLQGLLADAPHCTDES